MFESLASVCYYGKPQCEYSSWWAAAPPGAPALSLHTLHAAWQLTRPDTHFDMYESTRPQLIPDFILFWSQVCLQVIQFSFLSLSFPPTFLLCLSPFCTLVSLSASSSSSSFRSFFDNMTRITSPDYVPTETDVLRVRLRTTGVIETQFKVNHLIFR